MGKYFDRRTREGKAAELWSNLFSIIGSFFQVHLRFSENNNKDACLSL